MRARRPAAAHRARTPSGRTAGTSTATTTARPARTWTAQQPRRGARIGKSRYFIGDYTVEPENGGLGVFAHEYGHDLGLPDYYDTTGGENGTAFWTLMSSGSWLGHGARGHRHHTRRLGPGGEAVPRLAGLQRGQARAGRAVHPRARRAAPSAARTRRSRSTCPTSRPARTTRRRPRAPTRWWTGRGDDLNNTLTRAVPAASRSRVTRRRLVRHRGRLRLPLRRVLPRRRRELDHVGRADRRLVERALERPALLLQRRRQGVHFRFRYKTDGGVQPGRRVPRRHRHQVRQARRSPTVPRPAPTAGPRTAGLDLHRHRDRDAAVLPHREPAVRRLRRDAGRRARTSSRRLTAPDRVEHFAFQDGMLVWLRRPGLRRQQHVSDTRPGLALPVDARPELVDVPRWDAADATGASRSTRRSASTSWTRSACARRSAARRTRRYTMLEACATRVAEGHVRRQRPERLLRRREAAELGEGRGSRASRPRSTRTTGSS